MTPQMQDFELEVVIDKIGCKGGYGSMKPHTITIHHDGVVSNPEDDDLKKLSAYTKARDGVCPYHIYIPRENSKKIYVANYLTHYTYHNNNLSANKDSIAICLGGNFEVQNVLGIQLAKLRWLLDALQNGLLIRNGWTGAIEDLKPQDNTTKKTYLFNKTVNILHWHNEVGKTYTACAGRNLIPKVKEYREKKGQVGWGNYNIPITFNENQYLKNYSKDVKPAIAKGEFASGYDHYIQFGKKEGRTDKALIPKPPVPVVNLESVLKRLLDLASYSGEDDLVMKSEFLAARIKERFIYESDLRGALETIENRNKTVKDMEEVILGDQNTIEQLQRKIEALEAENGEPQEPPVSSSGFWSKLQDFISKFFK